MRAPKSSYKLIFLGIPLLIAAGMGCSSKSSSSSNITFEFTLIPSTVSGYFSTIGFFGKNSAPLCDSNGRDITNIGNYVVLDLSNNTSLFTPLSGQHFICGNGAVDNEESSILLSDADQIYTCTSGHDYQIIYTLITLKGTTVYSSDIVTCP